MSNLLPLGSKRLFFPFPNPTSPSPWGAASRCLPRWPKGGGSRVALRRNGRALREYTQAEEQVNSRNSAGPALVRYLNRELSGE